MGQGGEQAMVPEGHPPSVRGDWVTYRPDIRLLDCTIRDGGLMNNHRFDDDFVRGVYEACVKAGVDYMEMGYKASAKIFAPDQFGDWKHCSEDALRRIVGDNPSNLKISVMADTGRTEPADIAPRSESVIDLIRVATYIHQIPAAIELIEDAHNKGYETSVNVMAVSTVQETELFRAIEVLAGTSVDVIYLVDSFGSFYNEQIRDLSNAYREIAEAHGKTVGIHTHNNQQLAYSNTIEAVIHGVNFLDATMDGLGRGAGNCPIELLIAFLKNPKFHMRPVLECVEKHLLPLRKHMRWGYSIPYMITGIMNLHPRDAIKWMEGATPDEIVAFHDMIMADN
jgi:4-hydroxy 2-oxovalerate aldolase